MKSKNIKELDKIAGTLITNNKGYDLLREFTERHKRIKRVKKAKKLVSEGLSLTAAVKESGFHSKYLAREEYESIDGRGNESPQGFCSSISRWSCVNPGSYVCEVVADVKERSIISSIWKTYKDYNDAIKQTSKLLENLDKSKEPEQIQMPTGFNFHPNAPTASEISKVINGFDKFAKKEAKQFKEDCKTIINPKEWKQHNGWVKELPVSERKLFLYLLKIGRTPLKISREIKYFRELSEKFNLNFDQLMELMHIFSGSKWSILAPNKETK